MTSWTVTGSAAAGLFTLPNPVSGGSLAVGATTLSGVYYVAPNTNGPQSITLSGTSPSSTTAPVATVGPLDVGWATAAVSGSQGSSSPFGAALHGVVAAGGTYAGLGATADSDLYTDATIVAGKNNSGTMNLVSMAFRTRAGDESPSFAQSPPMGHSGNPGAMPSYLISDVLQLTGVGGGDVYALRMSYELDPVGRQRNHRRRGRARVLGHQQQRQLGQCGERRASAAAVQPLRIWNRWPRI